MKTIARKLKVLSLTLSLTAASTLVVPRTSQAIVGICSWNPVLIGAGLGVASGAMLGGAAVGAITSKMSPESSKFLQTLYLAIGGTIGMIGMIVLEDKSTALEFKEIDQLMQKKLNLTDEEVQLFNREIDQINLMSYQVAYELGQNPKQTLEVAKDAWNKYSSIVSPTTFKTLGKITNATFNQ